MAKISTNQESVSADDGFAKVFAAYVRPGILLAVGILLLFDTVYHLLTIYGGPVYSPLALSVRIILTAILGSTSLLAALSIALK